jgi:hypothetical protein
MKKDILFRAKVHILLLLLLLLFFFLEADNDGAAAAQDDGRSKSKLPIACATAVLLR